MKLICDQCGAKYSIADEKVRGKVFKIRCKKCENVIVVQGDAAGGPTAKGAELAASTNTAVPAMTDEALAGQSEATESPYPAGAGYGQEAYGAPGAGAGYYPEGQAVEEPAAPAEHAPEEIAAWYLLVGQQQVGPLTDAGVQEYLVQGSATGESYVWKEGFTDWVQLQTLAEFAEAAAAAWGAVPAQATAGGHDAGAYDAGAYDAGAYGAEGQGAVGYGDDPGFAATAGGAYGAAGAVDAAGPYGGGQVAEPGGPYDAGAGYGQAGPGAGLDLDLQASPAPMAGATDFGGGGGGGFVMSSQGVDGGLGFPTSASDDYASGPSALAAPPDDDGRMIGARNENSVLFSLATLRNLADGPAGAPSSTGGVAEAGASGGSSASGLIDIRALASGDGPESDGGMSGMDVPAAPPMATPLMVPMMARRRTPVGLIVGLVLALLLVVGLSVSLAAIWMNRGSGGDGKEGPTVAAAPSKPEGGAVAKAGAGGTAKAGGSEGDGQGKEGGSDPDEAGSTGSGGDDGAEPAAAGKEQPTAVAAAPSRPGARRPAASSRPARPTPSPRPSAAPRPAPSAPAAPAVAARPSPPTPAAPRPSRGGGSAARSEVDDLLSAIEQGGQKPAPAARPAARPAAAAAPKPARPVAAAAAPKRSLGRDDVSRVVRANKSRIQSCYLKQAEPKLSGTITVSFAIMGSGKVGSASIRTAKFEGTPVGRCVLSAVRSFGFPPHTDPPVKINYPFILR